MGRTTNIFYCIKKKKKKIDFIYSFFFKRSHANHKLIYFFLCQMDGSIFATIRLEFLLSFIEEKNDSIDTTQEKLTLCPQVFVNHCCEN